MALALVILADCATIKIHQTKRMGHYTFDPAAVEPGPPDKPAKLSAGSLVVD